MRSKLLSFPAINIKGLFIAITLFLFIFLGRGGAFLLEGVSIYLFPFFGFVAIFFSYSKRSITNILPVSCKCYLLFLFFFLAYSLCSIFYSPAQSYGLEKVSLLTLFCTIFALFVFTSGFRRSELLTTFSVIALPMALYYLAVYVVAGADLRQGISSAGSITTGRIFAFCFFCSLFFYFKSRDFKFAVISIILLVAVFLSGSRGNFLAVLTSVVLTVMFFQPKHFVRALPFFLICVAVLVNYYGVEGIPFFYRYQLLFDGGGDSILVRFDSYKTAWNIFLNNPVFGVGAGGYAFFSLGGIDAIDYPHSIILELLAEYGLIGTSIFFGGVGFGVWCIKKDSFLLSVFIFYFLSSLSSGDIFDARILLVCPLLKLLRP